MNDENRPAVACGDGAGRSLDLATLHRSDAADRQGTGHPENREWAAEVCPLPMPRLSPAGGGNSRRRRQRYGGAELSAARSGRNAPPILCGGGRAGVGVVVPLTDLARERRRPDDLVKGTSDWANPLLP